MQVPEKKFGIWNFVTEHGPKLEMLCFVDFGDGTINAGLFSGLASLPSLKKFELSNSSFEGKEAFVEDVRGQLAQNPNRPALIKW